MNIISHSWQNGYHYYQRLSIPFCGSCTTRETILTMEKITKKNISISKWRKVSKVWNSLVPLLCGEKNSLDVNWVLPLGTDQKRATRRGSIHFCVISEGQEGFTWSLAWMAKKEVQSAGPFLTKLQGDWFLDRCSIHAKCTLVLIISEVCHGFGFPLPRIPDHCGWENLEVRGTHLFIFVCHIWPSYTCIKHNRDRYVINQCTHWHVS